MQRKPASLEFLGFDVADFSGISALSNCEYRRAEKERLIPIWIPRMNGHGLLTSFEHATEFRQLSDSRIPEHSPFWVYGLSRLPVSVWIEPCGIVEFLTHPSATRKS